MSLVITDQSKLIRFARSDLHVYPFPPKDKERTKKMTLYYDWKRIKSNKRTFCLNY